ncbi:uncharacterized protein METZ01_LOCUS490957, partial [marine metagenome]
MSFSEGVYGSYSGGTASGGLGQDSFIITGVTGGLSVASFALKKSDGSGSLSGGETQVGLFFTGLGVAVGTEVMSIKVKGDSIYDASGNSIAGDSVLDFATNGVKLNDTKVPTFATMGAGIDGTKPYPAVDMITGNSVELKIKINEDGTAYYVVLAGGVSTPSSANVKAGKDGGGIARTNGTQDLTAGTEKVVTIAGLASEKAYDIYVVAA